jgi:hypothetical protein
MVTIKAFGWRDVTILLLALTVVFVVVWAGRVVDTKTCDRFNILFQGFTDSLERSKAAIPTIAYYKTHPEEKQRALAEINHQLVVYKQVKC